jgi:tetratricopeptide (TPR) repeat protein
VRVAVVIIGLFLAAGLGAVQAVSSLALRGDARPPSWVLLVPPALAARVDALDPALPMPQVLRLVLARRALADGRADATQAYLARLAPSPDRAELAGRLAEQRGDLATAMRDYVDAGALDEIARRVDALRAASRFDEAFRLEQATLARIAQDPTQSGALPEAYYRLGLIQQSLAYQQPPDGAERERLQVLALHDYERALESAPFEERYLIAAANGAINVGDLDQAQSYFERAHELDPRSPVPLAGFGDVAVRRGDKAKAREYLEQAQRLDPSSDAVHRLANELGG